ncbi:hypothetical protein JCGZ_01720 [Jatropha curcas]|uniref:Uncharacterized protein n=1 Tax=Jatropha curcas TaxID=180498 RepID=A0A067JJI9_JATCU|nr:hypothetical protein JCGZ_01720 [Jatropha curcas]
MRVPVGFLAKLWSFVRFLPFFFLLLILGLLKGAIICPLVVGIIVIGNSAVIIGLWMAHFLWTFYCVAKTQRLGLVLKTVVLLLLPLPLVLWPVLGIGASILGGIGYGFFAPLIATFEAVGQNVKEKCYHCFLDGCLSTIKGSCTVVRDFTDFCFHSYFSFMDELSEKVPKGEKPVDIKLLILPSCLLVILIAVPVDMILITVVALWKSPYMLFRGWKRLLEDLIGREGPFLETVCVPFAGLAIILWPLAVIGAVIGAILSSFFLGLYSVVVVHQEDSLHMGLAYVVAVVSLFDEYVNDLLYLGEGSRLPRILHRDGLINIKDIEVCISKGDCKMLSIKLPAWSLLQRLLASAKSDSSGLVISDDAELTRPRDKLFEWLIGPLLIMKEQIKQLQLYEDEENCLRMLIMKGKNENPEDWDETEFPSRDNVRRAQLQGIIRRLEGIVAFMTRVPTFRRRFMNLMKLLYVEALQAAASSDQNPISRQESDSGLEETCKIDLKPWIFWTKKGCKSFELEGSQVDIHWDLRSARFCGSPEPCSDFYVALVSDGEVVLLLGDHKKKAYKRTKARPALSEAVLFYKKENVFAKKSFSTRAKFDQQKQEHDIVVESSTTGHKDPEMWISIDGLVVIHVKNLQWKFRGNQTVMVNTQPVQVFWDVHDWLFNNAATGHGLFIFKPGAPECDDDKDSSPRAASDNSDSSKYFSAKSNASTPEFCLFLYAWKIE